MGWCWPPGALTAITTPCPARRSTDPATGTWTVAGMLSAARQLHTATLLPNGMVLVVAGGHGSPYPCLSSTELYDSANGSWTTTGALTTGGALTRRLCWPMAKCWPREASARTPLPPAPSSTTRPAATWTPTAAMATRARVSYGDLAAQRKGAGRGGLLWGQRRGFHVQRGTVRPGHRDVVGDRAADRRAGKHTATLLRSGKVLVAGGFNTISGCTDQRGMYDPAVGGWAEAGALNFAREGHTATLLSNGQVLVAAGSDANGDLCSARNCMILPREPGRRPARSTPHASTIPRRCCLMERCWSRAARTSATGPSPARSCMTRPPGRGR